MRHYDGKTSTIDPGSFFGYKVLIRVAEAGSEEHVAAAKAIAFLLSNGAECFIRAQILTEFWAVATRPRAANGLGWEASLAIKEIERIRQQFPMLPDVPQTFDVWLAVVAGGHFSGKRAHDARLIAIMQMYGLSHLLTFNEEDFAHAPGITVVTPMSLAKRF